MGRSGSSSRSSGGRSGLGGSSRSSFSSSRSSSSRNHSSSSRSSSSYERSPGWFSAMRTKTPPPPPPREPWGAPPPPRRHWGTPPPVYREVVVHREIAEPTREMVYTRRDSAPISKRDQYERDVETAQRKQKRYVGMIVVAVTLFIMAIVVKGVTNWSFEKAELSGTKSVGFLKDDGFLQGSYRTEEALEEFYKETGIPLFLYTIAKYPSDNSTCDRYAEEMYDTLFTDENHALLVYYDNVDWWSWVAGNAVAYKMTDKTFNSLVDAFYYYWEQDITNDEVFAKGITKFVGEFTGKSLKSAGKAWSAILLVVAIGLLLYGGIFYLLATRKIKEKREALEQLEMERVLNTPLEKFNDSGVDDLKEKYK